jgi:hypothetical protein
LIIVLLKFIVQMFDYNSGFFKHGKGIFAVVVAALAYYAFYSAVNDKHGAGSARGHAAVKSGPINGNPNLCGLANGVLFGVNSSDAMGSNIAVFMDSFFELMPNLVAVGKACGGSDVTCYQNLPVFGNYAAGSSSFAGRPFGNGFADFHKIFVPTRPLVFAHYRSFPQFTPKF